MVFFSPQIRAFFFSLGISLGDRFPESPFNKIRLGFCLFFLFPLFFSVTADIRYTFSFWQHDPPSDSERTPDPKTFRTRARFRFREPFLPQVPKKKNRFFFK